MSMRVRSGPARAAALVSLGLAFVLAGCETVSDLLSEGEPPPVAGERLSVIALDRQLEPDPAAAALEVTLPPATVNEAWPQAGGYPHHAMHHLAAAGDLSVAWRADIGSGTDDDGPRLPPPVVADGRVFAMDSESRVSAFDAASGARLWTAGTLPADDDEGGFGGGLAVADGTVFAATGIGHVLALEAETGAIRWRQAIGVPVRSPPAVSGGRVFAISHDNRLWALDAGSGALQWSHAGIAESAGFLGGASPAVDGGIVVAPFSSGELVALRVENGRTVWADILTVQGVRVGAIATLNDIEGSPVIDRGLVLAIGHGGRLVAIDLRSGRRAWERVIAGLNTPWVAGDFVFVLSADGEVVCITRERGAIRLGARPLPRYEDPEDREDPIYWKGPALVGDRLLVARDRAASMLALSPYDGRAAGRAGMPAAIRFACRPWSPTGRSIILTDAADLIALR